MFYFFINLFILLFNRGNAQAIDPYTAAVIYGFNNMPAGNLGAIGSGIYGPGMGLYGSK